MKILVTGGAGFIASNIVDRYISDGHDVTVIDAVTGEGLRKIKVGLRPRRLAIGRNLCRGQRAQQRCRQHGIDLFVPLACYAWTEVDYGALAEALLRWKRKWVLLITPSMPLIN